jgi:hypothetical protein
VTTAELAGVCAIEGGGVALSTYVLCRRRGRLSQRLAWGILLLMPIVGPALYFITRPAPDDGGPEDLTSPEPFQDPGDFGGHDD